MGCLSITAIVVRSLTEPYILCFNITLWCVYKDPKRKSVKRHAYKVDFKLKAIIYAVEQWNRAAAREFNINEPIVQKWRKQEDNLS